MTAHTSGDMPRILFIPFEFLIWQRGRAWPYGIHLGLEEGLQAHGIEFMTMPSTYEIPSSYQASWLYHAERLCRGKEFDQVWLFLRHSQLEDNFLEWLEHIAPVRVGFVMESLTHLPEELQVWPHLAEIKPLMEKQLKAMTHVLAFDEDDAEAITSAGGRALWCPWALPQRFLAFPATVQRKQQAAFFGAVYGKREQFLSHPTLQNILVHAARTEYGTELPQLFDETATYFHARLHSGQQPTVRDLEEYLSIVRRIRRSAFGQYLAALNQWAANVVLPASFKGYSNRIIESAVARVPVISWDIPNRPYNRRLFEPEREILLFNPENPEELVAHIHRVLSKPEYAQELGQNLHNKVLFHHTIEVRIQQILAWIATGKKPEYVAG